MRFSLVKRQLQTFVSQVDGVGIVRTKAGGVATWLLDPRPKRPYWEITDAAMVPVPPGIGTCIDDVHTVNLDGWLPFSYENPDSTEFWDDLREAVGGKLRGNMSLGDQVWDAQISRQVNGFQRYDGQGTQVEIAAGGGTLCHYCRFTMQITEFLTFTTT